MKKVERMEKVLRNSESNPDYLTDILPEFQSFTNYGNILPYAHYQNWINEVCDKWQDSNRMAIIIKVLTDAYIQFCLGKHDRALELITDLSEKHDLSINPEHFGFSELLLGVCTRSIGHIDKAVVHLTNCTLSLDEFGALAKFSCLANYQLAELHLQISDIDNAGSFYKKALAIAERLRIKVIIFRSLSGLGSWYHSKGEYDSSIQCFKQALTIESIAQILKARVLCDIGKHYIALEQYEEALIVLKESYQMASEGKYMDAASTSLTYMGEAYLDLNKPTDALKVLHEAVEISLSLKTRAKRMDIEYLLARAYESIADYQEAYNHLKLTQQINKEIYTTRQGEIFRFYTKRIQQQKETIQEQRDRSDKLLLNILPAEIAEELKEKGEAIARNYDRVSVLFTDFEEFTQASAKLSAADLVAELNICFKAFDDIVDKYKIEKIKTIGDSYMCAGGLPAPDRNAVKNTVQAALEMQSFISKRKAEMDVKGKPAFEMRLGIHTGPIVAGIVGAKKFQYDIWGDTVNTASRLESSGEVGKVNISQATYEILKEDSDFVFESRGKIEVKGKGVLKMWFVSKK